MFDVMRCLHIVDVTGADKIDTWWMKLSTFLELTMILSELGLLIDRTRTAACSIRQPQAHFSDAGLQDWSFCSIPIVSATM